MKRNLLLLLLMLAATTFIGCNRTNKPQSSEQSAMADNSRNALDWAGTYRGIIPCADCEGIEIEISLSYEETFVIHITYLGKADQVFVTEGSFAWNEQGSAITLDEDSAQPEVRRFLVGENRLYYLDMQGNRITGPLADHYILEKMPE